MTLLRPLFSVLSPAGARARLSILIFHRVTPQVDPLFPGEADAQRFDDVLGWLKRWFNILPLDTAVQRLQEGSLPARAASITFDDGYADNATVALPLLQRHGLTATFFIATGYANGGRMWNDTVIEAVRRCAAPTLELDGLGRGNSTPLSLGRLAIATDTAKRAAIRTVLARIKYLPPAERAFIVSQIADRASAALPTDLMMTSAQLLQLRNAGMQIGAHTASHPILRTLNDDDATREIQASKTWLEQLLGERVALFAYPNGKPGTDYTDRDAALARRLGFDAAVSTAAGAATAGTNLFHLPRFTPWDRGRMGFGVRMVRNLR